MITLDDDEARGLGAVIGGAYERPKIVEELEMALGELQIEWIPVPDDSPWIGKTLAECGFRAKAGVTVIAILREPEPISGAQPTDARARRHARHRRQGRPVRALPPAAQRYGGVIQRLSSGSDGANPRFPTIAVRMRPVTSGR